MASEEGYSKPTAYEQPKKLIRVETQEGIQTPREKLIRKPLPVIPHTRYKLKPNSEFA